jgi:hypothetical protein
MAAATGIFFILRKYRGNENHNVAEFAGFIKVPLDQVNGLISPPVSPLCHCQKQA